MNEWRLVVWKPALKYPKGFLLNRRKNVQRWNKERSNLPRINLVRSEVDVYGIEKDSRSTERDFFKFSPRSVCEVVERNPRRRELSATEYERSRGRSKATALVYVANSLSKWRKKASIRIACNRGLDRRTRPQRRIKSECE